ncbi:acyl-CoA dehydrogenase family protein [Pseudooceanicola onchidii]|uniref:acyl-CoA dehydrogenase family protein n=1 Tax=Pseudooceanicola onchidii TaxID=2562279 RepID=UPI00145B9D24|nr:acyl-CoA dehydrogenase family protein [Pseudooceanicola onchidii]
MDFSPTDDQRMIADSFARVFEGGGGQAELDELGLLLAAHPEATGGFGAGVADLVPALVECGRAATQAPVIGAAFLPGLALTRAGIWAEGPACLDPEAEVRIDDDRLTGVLPVVPGADVADRLVMCLPDDRLAVVPLSVAEVVPFALVDGRGAAEVRLDGARATITDTVPGLTGAIQDSAVTLYAAEALGALYAIREMTQAYLKERRQFGRPLGSFQALQHAMVDLYHDIEHFQSLVHLAARCCDGPDVAMRLRSVSALKRYLGGRMRRAAASAIQMHGGIGVTEEYALGRYVKRVIVADLLNGSADDHGARLARLIAEETRAADRAAPADDLKENVA